MRKRTTMGVLIASLVGVGLYRFRRPMLGRALGLGKARYVVQVEHGIRISMPDGIELAADHYYPLSDHEKFPTILVRTPYGRGPADGGSGLLSAFTSHRFAERGYHVVVQDVRGRFGSQGEFKPFIMEASDGQATLAWIERQPWFNGSTGMWGQSYVGYVQWAAAVGAPQSLKALAPSITGSQLPIMGFRDRALGMDTLFRWILELDAMDRKGALSILEGLASFLPSVQTRRLQPAFSHTPLIQADELIVGKPVSFYQDWLTHPDLSDPYWQAINHSPRLDLISADVSLVSGWYDILLRELLADYASLLAAGRNPYLTIGPWTHLDAECLLESLRQGLAWFDALLKGDRRRLRRKPVRIFVMNADGAGGQGSWREMDSWPPPSLEVRYFLQEERRLSGDLPGSESLADSYIYDPKNPTPAVGGPLMSIQGGRKDNRGLEARSDVLTYTSPPLERDLEVIGTVRLKLYVHSSLENTDFFGRLCDVYPDGRSINVCDGMLRVEPGLGEPQTDGSLCLELEMWATANCFRRGHSLRLQVSSGAFPRWDRNLGSGEPLADGTRMFPAHQVIYHDRTHPSELILPVTNVH